MSDKTFMFQFATRQKIYVNTDLITKEEAYALVDANLEILIDNWDDFSIPQMVIWKNCKSDTDYSETELDIDYRDCEFVSGAFYRVKREILNLCQN